MKFILVFVGGGLGSLARYGLSLLLNGHGWPWGTLAANIAGSFLIGAFGASSARCGWGGECRLLLTVGVCGGFTTFSTLSNECLSFLRTGAYGQAVAYVAASLCLGVLAAAAGWSLFR